MLDSVPQLGHIPRLLKAMTARNDAFPKHSMQIIHQLSNSEVRFCVQCYSIFNEMILIFLHKFHLCRLLLSQLLLKHFQINVTADSK